MVWRNTTSRYIMTPDYAVLIWLMWKWLPPNSLKFGGVLSHCIHVMQLRNHKTSPLKCKEIIEILRVLCEIDSSHKKRATTEAADRRVGHHIRSKQFNSSQHTVGVNCHRLSDIYVQFTTFRYIRIDMPVDSLRYLLYLYIYRHYSGHEKEQDVFTIWHHIWVMTMFASFSWSQKTLQICGPTNVTCYQNLWPPSMKYGIPQNTQFWPH